jgi:flagellar protein FlaF
MYQLSYDEHLADNAKDCRDRERLALEHAIGLLQRAEGAGAQSQEAVEALGFVSKLWNAFIQDLVDPENDLPDVLRADRKVSIEILNDATFLLEAHVMKVEDASTPLRQLYFIIIWHV